MQKLMFKSLLFQQHRIHLNKRVMEIQNLYSVVNFHESRKTRAWQNNASEISRDGNPNSLQAQHRIRPAHLARVRELKEADAAKERYSPNFTAVLPAETSAAPSLFHRHHLHGTPLDPAQLRPAPSRPTPRKAATA
jgi:hypothetical protein